MPEQDSYEVKIMKDAVDFAESKLLDIDNLPSHISAKAMADQAAGMMIQDMRAFMQANEQVITVGIGKAIALSLDSENTTAQKGGVDALEALQKLLMTLPQFAHKIESVANSILTQFGNPKADYLKNIKQTVPSKK